MYARELKLAKQNVGGPNGDREIAEIRAEQITLFQAKKEQYGKLKLEE